MNLRDATQFFGKPADPKTRDCEWCSPPKKAESAWEIFKPRKVVGTGQYLYACGQHERLAKEASRAKKKAA